MPNRTGCAAAIRFTGEGVLNAHASPHPTHRPVGLQGSDFPRKSHFTGGCGRPIACEHKHRIASEMRFSMKERPRFYAAFRVSELLLLDLGSLAAEVTQIVQLRAANLALADHSDAVHTGECSGNVRSTPTP